MDRYDESKHVNTSDSDEIRNDEDLSSGPLGLGHSPVPKSPGDPTTSYDPESVARRRERALGEDERVTETGGQGAGATGIDMGAGGQGTDISGD